MYSDSAPAKALSMSRGQHLVFQGCGGRGRRGHGITIRDHAESLRARLYKAGDGELGGGRPRADGGDTADQRGGGGRSGGGRRSSLRARGRRVETTRGAREVEREVRREEVAFLFAAERSGHCARSAEATRGGTDRLGGGEVGGPVKEEEVCT
ncbi:hypothetical protein Scep_000951 [Stephania cephalantha]|uniref:Uncharacterized protein n=1 Tax=Stephania cephalantha TaxID=152367 RepID=A0AAP0Q3D0_9MAGN